MARPSTGLRLLATLPLSATLAFAAQERPRSAPDAAGPRGPQVVGGVPLQEVERPMSNRPGPNGPGPGGSLRGGPVQGDRELAILADAVRVLASNGYAEESAMLNAAIADMAAKKSAPTFDIQDRSARISALERIRDSFVGLGWESNAASLTYIIALGRAAEAGESSVELPRPSTLDLAPGQTLSDELTRIVSQAAEVFPRSGIPDVGRDAAELADFYRERRDRAARANDLRYIEGRAPVLDLVAGAFTTVAEEPDPEDVEWSQWMAARARARAVNPNAQPPRWPDEIRGMNQLIVMIQRAADLWEGAGNAPAAARCRELAEYYRARGRGEVEDFSSRAVVAAQVGMDAMDVPEEPAAEAADDRAALKRRIDDLTQEAEVLRNAIAELEAELARRRR